jgi:post-segregation antitoxin (ccd killing protein)
MKVRETKAWRADLPVRVETLRRKRQEAWLEENRDAIESYNTLVARDGTFAEGWRKF